MKMNNITVKELIERLSQYPDDAIVEVTGGEDYEGEFGYLSVGNDLVMDDSVE